MKRAKKTASTEADKRIAPDAPVLEKMAKLPEDVQRMALGYCYGLMAGRQISNDSGNGRTD